MWNYSTQKTDTWFKDWTSLAEGKWEEDLPDDLNSSVVDAMSPWDPPQWLVRLDQATTLVITFNTVTLMLGMGAATYWKEFWQHLKRPWTCLIGMTCQFALLPAVGFGLCIAFQLPPYEALGVLILACSPGGAFSNFFTYWVDGDLALSIMMTALSSLLAFGLMPLNVWLYTRRWTEEELLVNYIKILVSLVFVTVPVIVGMIVRHFTRRWASYISKVCGVLGWVGAVACGVLLVLRYWDIIVKSSISLVIAAALMPFSGFLVSYVLVKILCFSHKICRTVAIETGCQNMVVAISIILFFTDPQVRGQIVLYPVLYGLCQLTEVLVATGIFQAWVFAHRHDVTEEHVTSVMDTTILTSIPVPAHKRSQARMEHLEEHTQMPDVFNEQPLLPHHHHTLRNSPQSSYESRWCSPTETQVFIPHNLTTQHTETLWEDSTAIDSDTPSTTPNNHASHRTHDELKADFPHKYLKSDELLESAYIYDSDGPCSPALSNKGVPNMFPVTEIDFPFDREDSPAPYGSPIPSHNRRPLDPEAVECQRGEDSPTSISSISPSPLPYTRPFAFYHRDVRLGQTQQFSTFGRK